MAKTMVFIDSRVNNLDLLVSQFSAGTEYKVLDASYGGLFQMEESLAGKTDYSSIQIISHGAAGEITIGSTVLNSNNLLQYESQLDNIGHALTDSGDLLLYGCSVGAGPIGLQFVESLAQLTGADVAASNDLTGGVAAGGDWVLESATGSIESVVPVADSALQQYEPTLGYARDYELAELSYMSYFFDTNTCNFYEQKAIDIWSVIGSQWNVLETFQDKSFAATAFKRDDTIVIAYRGTDDIGDVPADWAVGTIFSDWNYQFDDAIKFAKTVDALNDGNDRVLVTGHSLGGALAQVVTQLFTWNGATFDPAGASDIIGSDNSDYEKYVKVDESNALINNKGPGTDFLNYCVTNSLVSGASGGHIGPIEYFDAYGNTFIQAARTTVIASAAAVNYWTYPVLRLLETYYLHSISGIVELMQAKAEGTEDAIWQNGYDTNLTKAIDTGDVGFSGTSSDQGQIEYYSSEYNPYVVANNRDNIIHGSAGNDVIYSFAGNDTVYGGDGNDLISTAEGNDVIDGGGGNDTIYAGSGDDLIEVSNGGKSIDAGSGDDTLKISGFVSGSYMVDGGTGFDKMDADLSGISERILWWDSSSNFLSSGSSYGAIHNGVLNGIDKLRFSTANNSVTITNIEQYNIIGTDGDDLLLYSGGNRYIGGKGVDTFYAYWSDAAVAIVWDNDPDSTITLHGAELSGFEVLRITTGSGDDFIRNTKVDTSDYIDTGAGNDTIDGGTGSDTIYAGSGDDTLKISGFVSGSYMVDGGTGFDKMDADLSGISERILWWDSSSNFLSSGSSYGAIHNGVLNGIDKLRFSTANNSVTITNIEQYNIIGTDGDDLLLYSGGNRYIGGKGVDTFYAYWSDAAVAIVWDNDPDSTITLHGAELSGFEVLRITTGSGDDEIRNTKVDTSDYIATGAGDDTIDAGGGSDTMIGGLGNDFYAVDSSGDVVTELASEGIDTVQSTISYILGANLENLILAGVSAINGTGNAAGNTIVGNSGNNSISGGEGNDTIYGGEGSDTAIFTGQFVDYVIDYNAGVSAYTVVDKIANRDGTDVISSVENFKFADGTKIMTSSIVDVVAPTASSFTPSDGIDSVDICSNIVLVFSEAIKRGVGTIAVHSGSATGPVVESYDTATSGNLTVSGATLTINPTSDLANGTHYFITLDAGSVKDITGNSYTGTDSYDFTTAAFFSDHNLHGSVTFWKTGTAIADVTSTLSSAPAATGTQSVEFRNIHVAADGTRSLEIWETSTKSDIQSVHLGVALPSGSVATWQTAADFSSGWNLSGNTDKPGEFTLDGNGTTALSSGSVKLGTITLTALTNPQHFELSLSAAQLGNDTVPSAGILLDSITTGTDGLYQQHNMTVGTYTLSSAKASGAAEASAANRAVDLLDAIGILKSIVGLTTLDANQKIAADFDNANDVDLNDAIAILKHVVGLPAPTPEWLFVNKVAPVYNLADPMTIDVTADTTVDLVGILRGDVDGSWAA